MRKERVGLRAAGGEILLLADHLAVDPQLRLEVRIPVRVRDTLVVEPVADTHRDVREEVYIALLVAPAARTAADRGSRFYRVDGCITVCR